MKHGFFSSIRGRSVALASIPLAFLFLVLGSTGWLRQQAQVTTNAVSHSDEVLQQIQVFDKIVTDASASASTFIFSYDPSKLARFEATVPKVRLQLNKIRESVSDNPAQMQRVDALHSATERGLATLRQYIALARRHDQSAIRSLIVANLKRAQTDSITTRQRAFELAEQSLKLQRLAKQRNLWRDLDIFEILAALLGVGLTIWLNLAFGKRFVKRIEMLSRAARGFSATREFNAQIGGHDELTDLQTAFGEMVQESKKREAQLSRYRLLAAQTRDLILFVRHRDEKILEANQAALEAYGYSRAELEQLSAVDLRIPEEREETRRIFRNGDHKKGLFEGVHIRKDGSTFPVEISAREAEIDGEDVVLCVIRDITERRNSEKLVASALERALDASRAKSEFVSTMSHEIRTPMNGVIGMNDLLLRTPLTQQQRDYALTVRESGQALLAVINDILDFSKIEAGKMELEIRDLDLTEVIEGVASLLMPQAHEKRLSLMSFVDPAIPSRLIGDPGRLRQVFMNLAGNAIKFTESGDVVISAVRKPGPANEVHITFSVRDTGIGLTEASQERLFEPFRQADGSASRRQGGTGLGLSISQRIVQLMGGAISIESAVGSGSTFSFDLILSEARGVKPARKSPAYLPHLLIVDDDPISANIISAYIASWNMTYNFLSDPREVIGCLDAARAAGNPFDVALIDLNMPYLTGLELANDIRNSTRFPGLALIMVTAFDQPDQARHAADAGFCAYLTKPIRQSQLYDAIIEAGMPASVPTGSVISASRVSTQVSALRILLADDNEINRRVAVQQLSALGYTAEAVSNGREAVSAAQNGEYDVILMDCQMPEMDGFEATRLLRKIESRTGHRTRIIAMTANALSRDRDQCLGAGMDDYISKPVMIEALEAALTRASQISEPVGQKDAASQEGVTLDMTRLKTIFSSDAEIQEFLISALPTLQDLCSALEAAPPETGVALAHELKGACANLGAQALSRAAARIERDCQQGACSNDNLTSVRVELDELRHAIAKLSEGVIV